jgi:hypothetical protein
MDSVRFSLLTCIVVCLGIFIFAGQYVWVAFCGTPEYAAMKFISKVAYYFLAMSNQRLQYYSAWAITDATVIASGLGYNGKDPQTGTHRFDRIISIYIFELEFASSPNIMIQVCLSLC